MDLIDLHAHTTASDGSCAPADLVQKAFDAGLKALAITDHDTLDGLDEALERGRALNFEVVPGVEISAEYKPGTMHILGYYTDYKNTDIASRLQVLQEARKNRNPKIAARLNELGFPLTMEEVRAAAGGGQVGRPHFARVMVEKKYVAGTQEAFDRYLTKGAPAYVDKFRLSPVDSIQLIRRAKGLPVLAHPFTLGMDDPQKLEELIFKLKEAGLAGLEVYYSEHTKEMTASYLTLAARLGLLITGGSDYHGISKPEIRLGRGLGDLAVPYDLLEKLKAKRKEME